MKKEDLNWCNIPGKPLISEHYFYRGKNRTYLLIYDKNFDNGYIEIELRSGVREIYFDSLDDAIEKINFMENSNMLKILRVESGLTQSELSKFSGVSVRMIQSYEQGVKNINHAKAITLYNLASEIGCTIEDLLEF